MILRIFFPQNNANQCKNAAVGLLHQPKNALAQYSFQENSLIKDDDQSVLVRHRTDGGKWNDGGANGQHPQTRALRVDNQTMRGRK